MATPTDHLTYLRREGFKPSCRCPFSADEMALLSRYGHWLEALARGMISPTTPEQERFVQVARGELPPETAFERICAKLRDSWQEASSQSLPDGKEVDSGPAEARSAFERLAEARERAQELRRCLEARREAILSTVRVELEALEAQYAQPLEEAGRAVAELEKEVKDEVLCAGQTIQVGNVHAIYYRGRVTWDSQGLATFAASHPEVSQFRRVGKPTVIVRYK